MVNFGDQIIRGKRLVIDHGDSLAVQGAVRPLGRRPDLGLRRCTLRNEKLLFTQFKTGIKKVFWSENFATSEGA